MLISKGELARERESDTNFKEKRLGEKKKKDQVPNKTNQTETKNKVAK